MEKVKNTYNLSNCFKKHNNVIWGILLFSILLTFFTYFNTDRSSWVGVVFTATFYALLLLDAVLILILPWAQEKLYSLDGLYSIRGWVSIEDESLKRHIRCVKSIDGCDNRTTLITKAEYLLLEEAKRRYPKMNVYVTNVLVTKLTSE